MQGLHEALVIGLLSFMTFPLKPVSSTSPEVLARGIAVKACRYSASEKVNHINGPSLMQMS
jgi:hypothetical protein